MSRRPPLRLLDPQDIVFEMEDDSHRARDFAVALQLMASGMNEADGDAVRLVVQCLIDRLDATTERWNALFLKVVRTTPTAA
jgi:hypothetical protein